MHGSWWREITHFSRQNCWLWTHVSLKMTPVNRDLQRLNQKSLQVSTSLGFTASTPVCSTNTVETQTYFLYAKKHTKKPLHTAAFTHRCLSFTQSNFYTQKPLHTYAFTQSITKQFLPTDPLTHSHTDAFTHRSVYTQKPMRLHTEAVTHRRLCTKNLTLTEKLLHAHTFTHRKLLHTEAFTQRSLYTEQLLHAGAFTHRSFCTEQFHGSNSFALGTRKTICDNIFPTQRSHPCLTNFLVEAAVQCHRFLQHFQCLKRSAVETRGAWKDF